jgi:TolA-binding protein
MRITIFTLALILGMSCSRRQPQPVAIRVPVPPVPPAPPASAIALEDATREFARADYAAAARNFQQYLNLVPSGGQRDQALFHLGLIFSQPGDSRVDWQRAGNYFNQVVNEFPTSPLKPAAQLILTLKSETVQLAAESDTRNQRIRQLNAELERLIRIDSERRPK